MRFIRARLVGFSALVLGMHLVVCGLVISATCDARHEHHDASSSRECHMPAEQAQAYPMHHAASTDPSSQHPSAPSLPAGPSLRCDCGASSVLDALTGTPYVLGSVNSAGATLAVIGAVAMSVPTILDEPAQVALPPPRA